MNRIYLDHAATTPLDEQVLKKMMPYFTDRFGNADSPHGIGRQAVNAVECAIASEEGGAAAIALHGHTRVELYSGRADRELIADVKK